MPLPKPSKTVSRRIKKPKPPLFTASLTEHRNAFKPPSKPQQRERRIRVICTDPDATDSSSDEEEEDALFRTKFTQKRLVREICLPVFPTISSFYGQQERTVREDAPFRPKLTHERPEHEFCFPASPPNSFCDDRQEEVSIEAAFSSSSCLSVEKRKGCKGARKDVGLHGLHERTDGPSVGAWVDNLNASLAGVEEFAQFLSEFLGVQEESCIPVWDEKLDLLDDSTCDSGLDLELDFEPATWINSVQALA